MHFLRNLKSAFLAKCNKKDVHLHPKRNYKQNIHLIKMKRKTIAITLLLLSVLTVSAQEEIVRGKSVYLEVFGPSNYIGVNYDARFSKNSKWGYRVGFGFGYSSSSDPLGDASTRAYSVPLGVNYFVGNNKHNLELGLGVNVGLYNNHDYIMEGIYGNDAAGKPQLLGVKSVPTKETKFGMFGFGTVGYRYTAKKGFQFRIGVTPARIIAADNIYDRKTVLMPYISFGKAF